jgi:predicted DNA-binding protein
MKDDQITLRLPRELTRAIARRARQSGVPRSQVVREAIVQYLAAAVPGQTPENVWERLAPLVGSVALDHAAAERDALARRIRAHNWRG